MSLILDGQLMLIVRPLAADLPASRVHASRGRSEIPPSRFFHLGVATVMQPDDKLFIGFKVPPAVPRHSPLDVVGSAGPGEPAANDLKVARLTGMLA